ncbi:MAG: hypothetical protein K2Q13_10390 [Nitrosomonas sp.]|uniref:hypothetical protein n=1 Tax=Nitrosomonas sp. TaxID=42353 RepID=UPI0025E969D7|nr:hypothetical protein [Nitrosomonas sp.]MBY0475450.1 hypothetical protein [Nitrosomonas sp.]
MYKNTDMKSFRTTEGAHVTRIGSFLMIAVLLAVLAWMGERDHQAKLDQVREAAQCNESGDKS